MARISKIRGRNAELNVAKYLECQRAHFEKYDLVHDRLSVEVKHRARLATLEAWMCQSEAAAPPGRLPIVVTHSRQQKIADCICLVRLSELKKLLATTE